MPLNQELTYSTICGGLVVLNARNDRPGTIGFIGTTDGADRWIVSCYHVLCRTTTEPFDDGETILQGRASALGREVAHVHASRTDASVDCAAALIDNDIAVSTRILGLPPLRPARIASKGMRVLKSGATTGVTEGIVFRVAGDTIEIRAPEGSPKGYEVSGFGDSGALWVEADSLAPIALHFGMRSTVVATAVARPIANVLATLRMSIARDE